ncbi:MAG: translation initiation factor 2 [Desulfotomaculaceae bacterium]|nr:translation initiation factor 2 [Desulfotomaculaceae bacterium]
MNDRNEIYNLQKRIQELEERVEQLRLSRRVLMYLIEKIEKERTFYLNKLERENQRLHQDNYRYARRLLSKNRQIIELEEKLGNPTSSGEI